MVARARIILLAAEGKNQTQIAQALGVSVDMARLWRNRWHSFYWLTPAHDPDFEVKVANVGEVYQLAPARHEQGERTVSSDELTGV